MTNVILIGPPGAGKGTQATYIADKLNIVAISTGEIFRHNVRSRTPLGEAADSYMSAGKFVPDSITNEMLRERLEQPDLKNGFLLDGYPRNTAQVDFLEQVLADKEQVLDVVVQLVVDPEELTERLLLRATSENRSDDTSEVIRHRMAMYFEQTTPVTALYEERGLLTKVHGVGSVSDVAGRISTALDVKLGSPLSV